MRNIRFYREFSSKQTKRLNAGGLSCIAVYVDTLNKREMVETIGAAMYRDIPNDDCLCPSVSSLAYIRESCKRISEKEARAIHPALFTILDSEVSNA